MKVGLTIGVRRLPQDARPMQELYRDCLETAVLAEELGWDQLWMPEHHGSDLWAPSPLALLTAIAARTSHIRLGTYVVLLGLHNPLRMAEDIATIGREQRISADSHMMEPPDLSAHYERFWAACQDVAMPVNMHINSGPGRRHFSPPQRSGLMPDGAVGHKWECMHAVGNLIAAGVLERYPGLRLVLAEAGVGWIPFFAQEFDYYQVSFAPSSAGVGRQRDIPRRPSEYIYGQVYGAFICDAVGCKLLPDYGLDTFMWSNDYPHSACIWPGATRFIAQDLGHLRAEDRAKVLCGNAARLYNDGQLPPPADPPGDVRDLEAWNQIHWHE